MNWQAFVIEHGAYVHVDTLAAVAGVPAARINRFRDDNPCRPLSAGQKPKSFSELFLLWHGRAPADSDWPAPRKIRSEYVWQDPEILLLASLVGQSSPEEIAALLTQRLRHLTGDPAATRSKSAVLVRMNQTGLVTTDVMGGITVKEAGKAWGSTAGIYQAIQSGELESFRVGRLRVIPHAAWNVFMKKAARPPEGFVQLSSIREALGIRSDAKLSEFAKLGYVPTAVRCHTRGSNLRGTQYGTWFIEESVAETLVADRRAGRPMPWHGQALPDNLRATYRKWSERKHPPECATCALIWGEAGAPVDLEAFSSQYPPLAHGAKRHLTRPWMPGLTVAELAAKAGVPATRVTRAITAGVLSSHTTGPKGRYITLTDATRWIARKCPTGDSERSWLSIDSACQQYGFSRDEVQAHIDAGRLISRVGKDGAMRGIRYVLKQQCSDLRANLGYTLEDAAARLGINAETFQALADGVSWRQDHRIPQATLDAVRKRIESRSGVTPEEAAEQLGTSIGWVRAHIEAGTVRVTTAPWAQDRVYLTNVMLERLRRLEGQAPASARLGADWVRLSKAAHLCGVSTTTVTKWQQQGLIETKAVPSGIHYQVDSLKDQSRRYWSACRFLRMSPPEWLQAEQERVDA